MARLPIVLAPDPRLSAVAEPVACVDESIRCLMDDMLETMYAEEGCGLAANQVGVLKRVIVMDLQEPTQEQIEHASNKNVSNETSNGESKFIYQMANPEIVWSSEAEQTFEEGCLSIPEQRLTITRPDTVAVRYLDRNNEKKELEMSGFLAACVQHEIDHLDGILIYNRISPLKRSLVVRRLEKQKRVRESL